MNQFLRFLDNLKTNGLEMFGRYYSTYPAIVTDINDPEKRGRVKVICPSIYGMNYNHPQWAEMSDSAISAAKAGSFFPPYVGGYVEVEFEHGDLAFPMYSGGYIVEGNLPSDFTASYGNVRGWVFQNGTKLIIDETPGKAQVLLFDTTGVQIKMGDSKIAIGTQTVELLDQIVKFLGKIADFVGGPDASHTHLGNLGAPTPPPINAAQFTLLQQDLLAIQKLIKSIMGTI